MLMLVLIENTWISDMIIVTIAAMIALMKLTRDMADVRLTYAFLCSYLKIKTTSPKQITLSTL